MSCFWLWNILFLFGLSHQATCYWLESCEMETFLPVIIYPHSAIYLLENELKEIPHSSVITKIHLFFCLFCQGKKVSGLQLVWYDKYYAVPRLLNPMNNPSLKRSDSSLQLLLDESSVECSWTQVIRWRSQNPCGLFELWRSWCWRPSKLRLLKL